MAEVPAFELAKEDRECRVCVVTVDELKGQFKESERMLVTHREF